MKSQLVTFILNIPILLEAILKENLRILSLNLRTYQL